MALPLIIGLGNPGNDYAATRHNVGWLVVDELARRAEAVFREDGRYGALCARAVMRGGEALLVKPLTYMNRSGETVAALMADGEDGPGRLLVVVDDVALALGRLRFRGKGSSGGHNGLKSISACLETEAYARLRFGIGVAESGMIDHVLGAFSEAEWPAVRAAVARAADGTEDWLEHGLEFCQNAYNSDPAPASGGPDQE